MQQRRASRLCRAQQRRVARPCGPGQACAARWPLASLYILASVPVCPLRSNPRRTPLSLCGVQRGPGWARGERAPPGSPQQCVCQDEAQFVEWNLYAIWEQVLSSRGRTTASLWHRGRSAGAPAAAAAADIAVRGERGRAAAAQQQLLALRGGAAGGGRRRRCALWLRRRDRLRLRQQATSAYGASAHQGAGTHASCGQQQQLCGGDSLDEVWHAGRGRRASRTLCCCDLRLASRRA